MRRVVAVACVGALFLFGGCSGDDDATSDDPSADDASGDDAGDAGTPDGAAAVVGLSEALASVDVFAEERPELDRCPFGELDPVVDDVAAALETELDLPDRRHEAFPLVEGTPAGVSCTASSGAGGRVALRATYQYPGRDHEEVVVATFATSDVAVEDRSDRHGGEVISYCYVPRESDGPAAGCGADWVSAEADLVVSLTVEELAPTSEAVAEVLDEHVEDLVGELAETG